MPVIATNNTCHRCGHTLSVQDIAMTTGVTFETAKSRLRYARQALRRMLQEFA